MAARAKRIEQRVRWPDTRHLDGLFRVPKNCLNCARVLVERTGLCDDCQQHAVNEKAGKWVPASYAEMCNA